MSFFAMPLAQTWLAITMFKAPESICSLQARKVICKVAPGQALLCFDTCPEKRDESNPHTIGIGWLKFIPFFGTLQSHIFKGHMAKKDIPLPGPERWRNVKNPRPEDAALRGAPWKGAKHVPSDPGLSE
jgi:hypothetical protein